MTEDQKRCQQKFANSMAFSRWPYIPGSYCGTDGCTAHYPEYGLTDDEERALVMAEANSWKGTPYRNMGWTKGKAADCALWIAKAYHQALPHKVPHFKLVDPTEYTGATDEIKTYPHDWFNHRSEEVYLQTVEKFAHFHHATTPSGNGDLALYWYGRCRAHGAVVDDWPYVIHAFSPWNEVARTEGNQGQLGGFRPDGVTPVLAGFWTLWG